MKLVCAHAHSAPPGWRAWIRARALCADTKRQRTEKCFVYRKLIFMQPAGLLKNRRGWLAAAAAAGQTIQLNLQYLHIYRVNACTHMRLHGCVHVRAAPAAVSHYCISGKNTDMKEKVAKNSNQMRKRKRGERWCVGGVSRDGARGWGELTEGRQRACDRATQVSH